MATPFATTKGTDMTDILALQTMVDVDGDSASEAADHSNWSFICSLITN